jgi:threonine/homoserine/homoserine lactone efflux protein
MAQDIFTAIPVGILLSFMLGPVFFVLLETAAMKGVRAALAFDAGVILADMVFLLVAYFGTNQLLEKIKDEPALFIFGGTILGIYSVISFLKVRRTQYRKSTYTIQKLKGAAYFEIGIKGFLLNFINVGVLGFWLAVIIIFGPALDMEPQRLSVFFATILITYLMMDILKMLAAKRLNNKLTPTRVALSKKIIAIIMMVFSVVLIFKGIFPGNSNIEKRMEEKIEKYTP